LLHSFVVFPLKWLSRWRVCCPNAISSIKPSSIKKEVVLVKDVVILALTVDITFIKLKSNPLPPAEIK
jgi:hypothetical protein